MSVELWLVRHGQTEWNADRRYQGWADVPLDEVGRAQARALAEDLDGVAFDSIWSSDLTRAVETARLAIGRPRIDARLRELDFGTLEGMRWDELDDEVQTRLLDDVARFEAPGGESVVDLRSRVVELLEELPPGRHAIVTHGGVVRVAVGECGVEHLPDNTEVVRVDWSRRVVVPRD